MDLEYVPLPIKSFIAGPHVAWDLFLKLNDDKYVRIVKAKQPFDPLQLKRYNDKQVENIYLRKDDLASYIETCLQLARQIARRPQVTSHQKLHLMAHIGLAIHLEAFYLDFNFKTLEHCEEFVKYLMPTLFDDPHVEPLLVTMAQMDNELFRHSLAVCTLSTMICIQMKWQTARTLKVIALGGFLHDIGYRFLPPGLHSKSPEEMSPDEYHLYETHPEKGADFLVTVPGISEEVVLMVQDHHEEGYGRGFPKRKTQGAIYPLSRVIRIADFLANHLIKSQKTPAPPSPDEILRLIRVNCSDCLTPDLLAALKRIFKK